MLKRLAIVSLFIALIGFILFMLAAFDLVNWTLGGVGLLACCFLGLFGVLNLAGE